MVGHNKNLNERFESVSLSQHAGLLFPGEDAKILANLAEDPGNCPMSTCCCMKFEAALSAVIRHELQQTDLSEQIKSIEVEDAKVQKELDKALKHLADVQVRVMVHDC